MSDAPPSGRSKSDLAIIVTLAITLVSWIAGAVWLASGMSVRMGDLERRVTLLETSQATKLDAIQGAITDVQVQLAIMKQQITGMHPPSAP